MLLFPPPHLSAPAIPEGPDRRMPWRDLSDQRKHMTVIERLATELERTVDEIYPLYAAILARLRCQAKIEDYLPILVSKRIKRLFRY